MAAITGAAGLPATLAAVARRRHRGAGQQGGAGLRRRGHAGAPCGEHGATLLPVDSEHNAIFQAMADGNRGAVERITLTASGGPFRTATMEEMRRATPEAALRHPVWSMGAKISIDSATMMNKGLEVIEAARLFALDEERIEVLVHPQSVVHGMVHYADGSVLAQLGSPDMRVPIAHTLAWPCAHRDQLARGSTWRQLGRLDFEPPDMERFPALRLAREALRAGGGARPCCTPPTRSRWRPSWSAGSASSTSPTSPATCWPSCGAMPADTLPSVLAADAAAREAARRRCETRRQSAA